MTIRIVDPTADDAASEVVLATAPAGLSGLQIGLLDNTKIGTARLYDFVEELLLAEHGVGSVLRRRKGNMSAPAEDHVLSELASCDLVLSGVGD